MSIGEGLLGIVYCRRLPSSMIGKKKEAELWESKTQTVTNIREAMYMHINDSTTMRFSLQSLTNLVFIEADLFLDSQGRCGRQVYRRTAPTVSFLKTM